MKNFPEAWGQQEEKGINSPQENSKQMTIHRETSYIPTRYALGLNDLRTYILTRKSSPQYQQP